MLISNKLFGLHNGRIQDHILGHINPKHKVNQQLRIPYTQYIIKRVSAVLSKPLSYL